VTPRGKLRAAAEASPMAWRGVSGAGSDLDVQRGQILT